MRWPRASQVPCAPESDNAVCVVHGNPGVLGVVILNSDGIPIRTTLERQDSVQVSQRSLCF
jgi:hypothetical protein